MIWTKISDDHFDREEIFELSRGAALLDIEAKVWCNRLGTDGHVPASMLTRLTTSPDALSDVAELVARHVWEVNGNGWQLDWSEQETAVEVAARREANAQKQQAFRERRDAHSRGDHSKCDARFCPNLRDSNGHVTGHVTSYVTGVVTDTRPDPARPVPSRPGGTGTGTGTGTGAHAATPPARREPHQWQDDSSGISCEVCGLPQTHKSHDVEAQRVATP